MDAPAFSFEQLAGAVTSPGPHDGGPALPDAERLADLEAARVEGYQQGLREAQAQLASAAAAFGQGYEELLREKGQAADHLEREAVELALLIAEKVVGGSIAVKPEVVIDVVSGALRRIVERQTVVVLVNPDDLDVVRESSEAIVAELGGIDRIDIQSERRVPPGGCVLRTAAGEVDARVGAQLERAREAVEAELGG